MPRHPPRPPLFPYTTLFRSFTADLFGTGFDAANRAAVRAVPRDSLDLVGLAFHGPKNAVDKVLKGERRSEEHTSELQSHVNLVCRLLLEIKNNPVPPPH